MLQSEQINEHSIIIAQMSNTRTGIISACWVCSWMSWWVSLLYWGRCCVIVTCSFWNRVLLFPRSPSAWVLTPTTWHFHWAAAGGIVQAQLAAQSSSLHPANGRAWALKNLSPLLPHSSSRELTIFMDKSCHTVSEVVVWFLPLPLICELYTSHLGTSHSQCSFQSW